MPAAGPELSSSPVAKTASSNSKVVQQLAAIDQSLKVEKDKRKLPWIKTTQAHTFFGIAIIANAVFIGVDVELGIDGFNLGLWIAESIFLVIFCVEISMRLWAERPYFRRYFDIWGIFDVLVTLLGCIDAWVISVVFGFGSNNPLSSLTVLRVFRLVRLVRLLRLVRMFSELVVLVQTIGSSMVSVAWMSLLLLLVMYTGSVATVLVLGQPYQADDPEIAQYFGSLGSALFSHFCVVTLENWPAIASAAMRHSQWWALYFVGMIVFTNFALVNLMVGVIVQRIMLLSREQETELASFAAESDQFRSTLQTLFNSMDLNFDNAVNRADIRGLLKKTETQEIMSAFGINLSIPSSTLNTIMDLDDEGTTTFQEFFEACIRLCGSQHSVHSVFVQHDICKCRQDVSRRMGRIEHMVQCLGQGQSAPPGEAARGGAEAQLHELLERMDRLGHAQERLLADAAALRVLAGEAAGGAQTGTSPACGSHDDPFAPGPFAAGASQPAGSLGRVSSAYRLDASPGALGPAASRRTGPGPPTQSLKDIVHRTGQEIKACCVGDPIFGPPPQESIRRSLSAGPGPRSDLRAAKRRELEAEYSSKRGVAFLSPH